LYSKEAPTVDDTLAGLAIVDPVAPVARVKVDDFVKPRVAAVDGFLDPVAPPVVSGRPSVFMAASDKLLPDVKVDRDVAGRAGSLKVKGSGAGRLRFDDWRRCTGGLGTDGAPCGGMNDLALENPGREPEDDAREGAYSSTSFAQ
jgi:hypothetical protein